MNIKKNIVFSCYNLYTFYVSFAYSEYLKEFFQLNSTLIWRNTISQLPDNLLVNWNGTVEILPSFTINDNRWRKNSVVRKTWHENKCINKFLNKFSATNDKIDFVFIFKDNCFYDIKIVKFFKFKSKAKIVLIEEGNGIYTSSCKKILLGNEIKRLILGLPKETLYGQGQSNLWDYVICKYPELFNKTNNRDIVLQQSKIFDSKYLTKFLKSFQINQTVNKNFDCIYFSQPLSESGLITNNQEIQAINTILASLPTNKKIGIKLHQRENCNKFDEVIKKFPNVEILDQILQSLPGEMIYFYFKPILLTPFSSVATNILFQDPNATIILLYKYFSLPGKTNIEVEKLFNGKKVLTNLEEYFFTKIVNEPKNGAHTDTPALDEIIQIFSRGL